MNELQQLMVDSYRKGVEYKKIKDVYKRLKGTPITAEKILLRQDED